MRPLLTSIYLKNALAMALVSVAACNIEIKNTDPASDPFRISGILVKETYAFDQKKLQYVIADTSASGEVLYDTVAVDRIVPSPLYTPAQGSDSISLSPCDGGSNLLLSFSKDGSFMQQVGSYCYELQVCGYLVAVFEFSKGTYDRGYIIDTLPDPRMHLLFSFDVTNQSGRSGFFLDNRGLVHKYASAEDAPHETIHGPATPFDALVDNTLFSYTFDERHTVAADTVSPDTLFRMSKLIYPSSKGSVTADEPACFDCGNSTYLAYIYDSMENRYIAVFLGSAGDVASINLSESAGILLSFLGSIREKVFW